MADNLLNTNASDPLDYFGGASAVDEEFGGVLGLPTEPDFSDIGVVEQGVTSSAGVAGESTGLSSAAAKGIGSGIAAGGAGLGSIIGGIGSMISGGIMAETNRIRAKTAEETRRFNAKMAQMQADRVMENLKVQEEMVTEQGGKLISRQKSAFASQGVKVNTGVAQQVQQETRNIVAENIDNLRTNAGQRALGYKVQAMNQRLTGMAEAGNFRAAATESLLTGGARFASGLARGTHKIVRG